MKKLVASFSACILFVSFCYSVDSLSTPNYSFIVAGHAYGSHHENNIGIHPPFLNALKSDNVPTFDFLVFTGDLLRSSKSQNIIQVKKELNGTPFYLSKGNHERSKACQSYFEQNFGNTYYSFTKNTERFIILDSQEKDRAISKDQIIYLKKTISDCDSSVKNVFVFFHELLWMSDKKYENIKSNRRSRYKLIKDKSNFWTEVFPILKSIKEKGVYVFAGDVGGNEDAIPAFYEIVDSVHLIASGMGEVSDENFLLVKVKSGDVNMSLYSLSNLKENRIEIYTPNYLEWYYNPKTPQNKLKSLLKRIYYSRVGFVILAIALCIGLWWLIRKKIINREFL